LLCQTYSALTCDYRAEQIGNQKNILILQILDVNSATHSARTEFLVNVSDLSSAAETKIKLESENEIKKIQDKIYQDTQNRLLEQLKSSLLVAEENLKNAEIKANRSSDRLDQITDSYNASKDKSIVVSAALFNAVKEYMQVINSLAQLLKKLRK